MHSMGWSHGERKRGGDTPVRQVKKGLPQVEYFDGINPVPAL